MLFVKQPTRKNTRQETEDTSFRSLLLQEKMCLNIMSHCLCYLLPSIIFDTGMHCCMPAAMVLLFFLESISEPIVSAVLLTCFLLGTPSHGLMFPQWLCLYRHSGCNCATARNLQQRVCSGLSPDSLFIVYLRTRTDTYILYHSPMTRQRYYKFLTHTNICSKIQSNSIATSNFAVLYRVYPNITVR